MPNRKYVAELKEEAVKQEVERGNTVADAATRLGASLTNCSTWVTLCKHTTTNPISRLKTLSAGIASTEVLQLQQVNKEDVLFSFLYDLPRIFQHTSL